MEEDSITIMVVRQSGKIRTVKIAPKKFYIFLAGLTGLVLAFFVLLYGYIEAYQRNTGLSSTVRSILESRESAPVQNAPSDLLRDSAWTEEIKPAGGEEEEIPTDTADSSVPFTTVDGGSREKVMSGKITIDEFRINNVQDAEALKFYFRLNNIEREGAMSGFLAVIGSASGNNGQQFSVFPNAPVNGDGILSDFRRGEWFSIRRFKYVQGILPLNEKIKRYSQLIIYVYSEDGKLLLRKTMDVVPHSS